MSMSTTTSTSASTTTSVRPTTPLSSTDPTQFATTLADRLGAGVAGPIQLPQLQLVGGPGIGETLALAPAVVLALTALALLGLDAVSPGETSGFVLATTAAGGAVTALALAGGFLAAGVGTTTPVEPFGGQLVVDGMSNFFVVVFTSVTALVVVASYDYLGDRPYRAEYYSLLLLAATGMSIMASANSLSSAFVALELSSLPSYALVAYLKGNRGSVEAGLKYFLIGALSSAVFAYGISLVYAVTGHFSLPAVAEALTGGAADGAAGVLGVGVVMIVGGFAFKTASVPFHFWAPEAYEGAPAPVSAFISSASKAAGFALAFRVFTVAFPETVAGVDWVIAFQGLALVTMTVGNFAAATQENVKRMLAYSSVGHAGYVLIALGALTGTGDPGPILGAGLLHLLVYGVMNTGAFLFVALVEYWDIGRTFEDYNGLATRAPVACVAMTVFMFSLAGLPVGGGFLSKFFLLAAAWNGGTWYLAVALIVNSALSLYFYSRVVRAMWLEDPAPVTAGRAAADGGVAITSYPTALYAAILTAAVVTVALLPALGVFSTAAFEAAAAMF